MKFLLKAKVPEDSTQPKEVMQVVRVYLFGIRDSTFSCNMAASLCIIGMMALFLGSICISRIASLYASSERPRSSNAWQRRNNDLVSLGIRSKAETGRRCLEVSELQYFAVDIKWIREIQQFLAQSWWPLNKPIMSYLNVDIVHLSKL